MAQPKGLATDSHEILGTAGYYPMSSLTGDFQVPCQTGILAEEEQQRASVGTCKWVYPVQGLQDSQKRNGLFVGQHMIALYWGTATNME